MLKECSEWNSSFQNRFVLEMLFELIGESVKALISFDSLYFAFHTLQLSERLFLDQDIASENDPLLGFKFSQYWIYLRCALSLFCDRKEGNSFSTVEEVEGARSLLESVEARVNAHESPFGTLPATFPDKDNGDSTGDPIDEEAEVDITHVENIQELYIQGELAQCRSYILQNQLNQSWLHYCLLSAVYRVDDISSLVFEALSVLAPAKKALKEKGDSTISPSQLKTQSIAHTGLRFFARFVAALETGDSLYIAYPSILSAVSNSVLPGDDSTVAKCLRSDALLRVEELSDSKMMLWNLVTALSLTLFSGFRSDAYHFCSQLASEQQVRWKHYALAVGTAMLVQDSGSNTEISPEVTDHILLSYIDEANKNQHAVVLVDLLRHLSFNYKSPTLVPSSSLDVSVHRTTQVITSWMNKIEVNVRKLRLSDTVDASILSFILGQPVSTTNLTLSAIGKQCHNTLVVLIALLQVLKKHNGEEHDAYAIADKHQARLQELIWYLETRYVLWGHTSDMRVVHEEEEREPTSSPIRRPVRRFKSVDLSEQYAYAKSPGKLRISTHSTDDPWSTGNIACMASWWAALILNFTDLHKNSSLQSLFLGYVNEVNSVSLAGALLKRYLPRSSVEPSCKRQYNRIVQRMLNESPDGSVYGLTLDDVNEKNGETDHELTSEELETVAALEDNQTHIYQQFTHQVTETLRAVASKSHVETMRKSHPEREAWSHNDVLFGKSSFGLPSDSISHREVVHKLCSLNVQACVSDALEHLQYMEGHIEDVSIPLSHSMSSLKLAGEHGGREPHDSERLERDEEEEVIQFLQPTPILRVNPNPSKQVESEGRNERSEIEDTQPNEEEEKEGTFLGPVDDESSSSDTPPTPVAHSTKDVEVEEKERENERERERERESERGRVERIGKKERDEVEAIESTTATSFPPSASPNKSCIEAVQQKESDDEVVKRDIHNTESHPSHPQAPSPSPASTPNDSNLDIPTILQSLPPSSGFAHHDLLIKLLLEKLQQTEALVKSQSEDIMKKIETTAAESETEEREREKTKEPTKPLLTVSTVSTKDEKHKPTPSPVAHVDIEPEEAMAEPSPSRGGNVTKTEGEEIPPVERESTSRSQRQCSDENTASDDVRDATTGCESSNHQPSDINTTGIRLHPIGARPLRLLSSSRGDGPHTQTKVPAVSSKTLQSGNDILSEPLWSEKEPEKSVRLVNIPRSVEPEVRGKVTIPKRSEDVWSTPIPAESHEREPRLTEEVGTRHSVGVFRPLVIKNRGLDTENDSSSKKSGGPPNDAPVSLVRLPKLMTKPYQRTLWYGGTMAPLTHEYRNPGTRPDGPRSANSSGVPRRYTPVSGTKNDYLLHSSRAVSSQPPVASPPVKSPHRDDEGAYDRETNHKGNRNAGKSHSPAHSESIKEKSPPVDRGLKPSLPGRSRTRTSFHTPPELERQLSSDRESDQGETEAEENDRSKLQVASDAEVLSRLSSEIDEKINSILNDVKDSANPMAPIRTRNGLGTESVASEPLPPSVIGSRTAAMLYIDPFKMKNTPTPDTFTSGSLMPKTKVVRRGNVEYIIPVSPNMSAVSEGDEEEEEQQGYTDTSTSDSTHRQHSRPSSRSSDRGGRGKAPSIPPGMLVRLADGTVTEVSASTDRLLGVADINSLPPVSEDMERFDRESGVAYLGEADLHLPEEVLEFSLMNQPQNDGRAIEIEKAHEGLGKIDRDLERLEELAQLMTDEFEEDRLIAEKLDKEEVSIQFERKIEEAEDLVTNFQEAEKRRAEFEAEMYERNRAQRMYQDFPYYDQVQRDVSRPPSRYTQAEHDYDEEEEPTFSVKIRRGPQSHVSTHNAQKAAHMRLKQSMKKAGGRYRN